MSREGAGPLPWSPPFVSTNPEQTNRLYIGPFLDLFASLTAAVVYPTQGEQHSVGCNLQLNH